VTKKVGSVKIRNSKNYITEIKMDTQKTRDRRVKKGIKAQGPVFFKDKLQYIHFHT
jgi:hypothetical protein